MQLIESRNYDSEFCGNLPLHFINLIQPHGYLIVTDKRLNIVQELKFVMASLSQAAATVAGLPKKDECIIGFRPEVIHTSWSGNPIQFEAGHKTYHPHNSLAIWQETVNGTSRPWHYVHVSAAEALRNALLEHLLKEKHSVN
jgi:light-regulated signal transduction histidine kinase (bacteriophytochrome)